MARKSPVPQLSEQQTIILLTLTKRRDTPQHLVRRIRSVLLAAEGQTDKHIAPQIDFHWQSVRTWRHRWIAQQEKLNAIEADADSDEKDLKKYIVVVVLADDPYNGVRGKYTPEQITDLYALACEDPESLGKPFSHWSCRELGDEMVRRGKVERFPTSTVWDFLKSRRLETSQSGRLDESQVRRS
jgi:hypothetical protein